MRGYIYLGCLLHGQLGRILPHTRKTKYNCRTSAYSVSNTCICRRRICIYAPALSVCLATFTGLLRHTVLQENYFFDGPNRELNSKRVVLRLRFYDTDKKAEITLKVS